MIPLYGSRQSHCSIARSLLHLALIRCWRFMRAANFFILETGSSGRTVLCTPRERERARIKCAHEPLNTQARLLLRAKLLLLLLIQEEMMRKLICVVSGFVYLALDSWNENQERENDKRNRKWAQKCEKFFLALVSKIFLSLVSS